MSKKPKRKTIGLLSETSFANFPGQLIGGCVQAAREHDFNLIRFTLEPTFYENYYTPQIDYILTVIKRVPLDGLIFVGWINDIVVRPDEFVQKAGGKFPLLSIGYIFPGIRSVYMDGQVYILELLSHLADGHDYRNIMFLQPYQWDDRYPAYEAFMKDRGLFKQELVINREDILVENDYYAHKRAKRICDLILKEKNPRIDALISPFSHEAAAVIEEFAKRGYKIPDDFAVVSLEDGERCRYAEPPLTAIHFPFFEIGDAACHTMESLLEGVEIPPVTYVPTTINYRRSCGCGPENILRRTPPSSKKTAGTEVQREIQALRLDILDPRFLAGIVSTSADENQSGLAAYVSGILDRSPITEHLLNTIDLIQRDLLRFNRAVRDATRDDHLLEKTATLVELVLVILRQKTRIALGLNEALHYGSSHLFQEINQHIVTTFDLKKLLSVMNESLTRIKINNCFIFLKSDTARFSSEDVLLFDYRNGHVTGHVRNPHAAGDHLAELFFHDDRAHVYYFFPLHIKQELIGFILIEPTMIDERNYYSLSIQLASALHESRKLSSLKTANGILESAKREIAGNLEVIREKSLQLEASNAKLSEIDNIKNNFIANVTHDFRSPLMIIMNLIDLSVKYFDTLDKETIQERLTTVFNAALRLKNTIDRLLEISRMDARGLHLSVRQIPFCSYIENLSDFYRSAVAASGIRIAATMPDYEIDQFYSDSEKLDEILNNLILNAIRFIDHETGSITLTVTDLPKTVRITVEDDGRGIPPDKLESIFDRYERPGPGDGRSEKASGIGLAFTRQLATLLQGSLRAESDGPGRGARFILELPKGDEAFHRVDRPVTFETGGTRILNEKRPYFKKLIESEISRVPEGGNIRILIHNPNKENEHDAHKALILIIDDNRHVTEIVREYLAHAGYDNFVIAYSFQDGIDAIRRFKPDIVICDEAISPGEGDAPRHRLLHDRKLKYTPVVFLSAAGDRKTITEPETRGTFVYLEIPIEEDELLMHVEHLVVKRMETNALLGAASVDEPTGLPNRRAIMEFLFDILSLRTYRPLSLIIMEIDHFKKTDDQPGTAAGEAVLSQTGCCLRDTLRGYDKAGRVDEGKFLVILPETALSGALAVAEKLNTALGRQTVTVDNREITVTASFGVVALPDHEEHVRTTLKLGSMKKIFEPEEPPQSARKTIGRMKKKIMQLLLEMAEDALRRAKKPTRAGDGVPPGEKRVAAFRH